MGWESTIDIHTDVIGAVEEVGDELRDIAGHRNALDGRLVDVAIWLGEHDRWKGEGLHRPEQFLAWRCGLTTQAARRYVQVAERAHDLPEAVGALRRGEISLDQLMPIVRNVPAWADGQVSSLAKRLSPGQVRRLAEQYDFASSGPLDSVSPNDSDDRDDFGSDETHDDPATDRTGAGASDDGTSADETHDDATDQRPPAPRDRSWAGTGDDGRFRLFLECTPELGSVISDAIDEVRDAALRASGNVMSDAEALAIVAERSLATIDDPARRDRFRTLVHVDTDGTFTDGHGLSLPDAMGRHVTCDGLLTPVFIENGIPVSVGRSQRIVPERSRRLILHRDGGCRVPGCSATHSLEVHHIIHWTDDGPTDTWNLIALCAHHHRLHHLGRLRITGNADTADGVTFTNEHGGIMNRDGPDPRPPNAPPPPTAGSYTGPIGERLDTRWVDIRHPDRLDPALRRDAT